jgi:hypothetical protein
MSAPPNPAANGSDRATQPANSESTLPATGWWSNSVAGFVPLAAGLVVLVTHWLGVDHADDP